MKLRDLDYEHAWAVIVTVQWFWEHHDEGIDIGKNPWWTLGFRRQWHRQQSGNKDGATTTEHPKESKRRKRNPSSKQ